MSSLNPEIRKIERVIWEFDRQIEEMHLKVHRYLSDRSKNPHPRHEEFIQRIFNYQIRGARSRSLELMLENVQYKASSRARIWKKWFEDDAKGLFRTGNVERARQKTEKTGDPLMDKIYERTKETWSKHGITNTESKEDFIERILPDLDEARKHLKKGQKIVFTYDKDTDRAQINIKDE